MVQNPREGMFLHNVITKFPGPGKLPDYVLLDLLNCLTSDSDDQLLHNWIDQVSNSITTLVKLISKVVGDKQPHRIQRIDAKYTTSKKSLTAEKTIAITTSFDLSLGLRSALK